MPPGKFAVARPAASGRCSPFPGRARPLVSSRNASFTETQDDRVNGRWRRTPARVRLLARAGGFEEQVGRKGAGAARTAPPVLPLKNVVAADVLPVGGRCGCGKMTLRKLAGLRDSWGFLLYWFLLKRCMRPIYGYLLLYSNTLSECFIIVITYDTHGTQVRLVAVAEARHFRPGPPGALPPSSQPQPVGLGGRISRKNWPSRCSNAAKARRVPHRGRRGRSSPRRDARWKEAGGASRDG